MTKGTRISLLCLVLAHLVLSLLYNSATPYRTSGAIFGMNRAPARDIGAPDERQHANYVQRLIDGKGFAVLDKDDPDAYENYQAHQPPIYYLLARVWAGITGVSDVTQPSAAFRMRALNSLIGAGTVAGSFFLAWWGTRRVPVALMTAAFVALLPMNAALSGAISNDPLLYLLCTWVLALCARGIRDGWTWNSALLIGILTGLALLTKTTALALLPALLIAALVPQVKKPSLAMVGAVGVIALVIAAPWFARNQKLYGDPLAMKAFTSSFTGNPGPEVFVAQAEAQGDSPGAAKVGYWRNWVGWWTARSFIGVFGYMDIFLNESGTPYPMRASESGGFFTASLLYPVLLLGLVAMGIMWLVSLRDEKWQDAKSVQMLTGGFTFVVVVLFIRFNMQYFQGQARYLFPALAPIAMAFAIGLAHVSKERWRVAGGVLAGILLAVNLYALARLPGEFAKRSGSAVSIRDVQRDLAVLK